MATCVATFWVKHLAAHGQRLCLSPKQQAAHQLARGRLLVPGELQRTHAFRQGPCAFACSISARLNEAVGALVQVLHKLILVVPCERPRASSRLGFRSRGHAASHAGCGLQQTLTGLFVNPFAARAQEPMQMPKADLGPSSLDSACQQACSWRLCEVCASGLRESMLLALWTSLTPPGTRRSALDLGASAQSHHVRRG